MTDGPKRDKHGRFKPSPKKDMPGKFDIPELKTPEGFNTRTPVQRKFRKLNRARLEDSLNKLMVMTVQDLRHTLADKDEDALTVWLASIFARGIAEGDHRRLEMVLGRTVGILKKEVELSVAPKPVVIERFDENDKAMVLKTVVNEAIGDEDEGS